MDSDGVWAARAPDVPVGMVGDDMGKTGRRSARFYRMRAAFWALFALLLLVRAPTLVEPAGADQDLYAYVGQAIGRGEVPYRDAWDQKPPAIHYTYAVMYALWPHPSVVPATDLLVATLTALGLLVLGRRLAPGSWAGEVAAAALLVAGHPALTRLGGIRVRAQCEVFMALAIVVAFALVARRPAFASRFTVSGEAAAEVARAPVWRWWASGALLGVAITYKYNAAVYLLPLSALALLEHARAPATRPGPTWSNGVAPAAFHTRWVALRQSRRALFGLCGGATVVVALMLAWFAGHGALTDLLAATISYNLEYSGETYGGAVNPLRYLLTFPVRHARIDALWFLGGFGCLVLLVASRRHWRALVWVAWVGAACLSIAINGSRGLPQYFVQAQPALALALGLALAWLRPALRLRGSLVVWTLLVVGAWRVGTFPKVAEYFWHDWQYLTGQITFTDHLARFGARDSDDKYSALAVRELADYLSEHTRPEEPVLVFGFSPGALVQSSRASATRFFWSRPAIVGFNASDPAYATSGLLADLVRRPPALVALQRRDWDDSADSASFFLGEPRLRAWLEGGYQAVGELGNFLLWRSR